MRTVLVILLALLSLVSLTAMDCWGGVSECSPPEGASLYSETLYCKDGERGFCRGGGHQGDSIWEPRPCLADSECTMVDGTATCMLPDGTAAPDPDEVCSELGDMSCRGDEVRRCEESAAGDLRWVDTPCREYLSTCHQGRCVSACWSEGTSECAFGLGSVKTCSLRVGGHLYWDVHECVEEDRCTEDPAAAAAYHACREECRDVGEADWGACLQACPAPPPVGCFPR